MQACGNAQSAVTKLYRLGTRCRQLAAYPLFLQNEACEGPRSKCALVCLHFFCLQARLSAEAANRLGAAIGDPVVVIGRDGALVKVALSSGDEVCINEAEVQAGKGGGHSVQLSFLNPPFAYSMAHCGLQDRKHEGAVKPLRTKPKATGLTLLFVVFP